MNTENKQDPAMERATSRVSALRGELEEHRAKPLSTDEWKDKEQELLKHLTQAEGELAKLTAQRGIVDA